jgi:general secretion pathway protein N
MKMIALPKLSIVSRPRFSKKTIQYILVGFSAYIIFILATIPAATVYAYWKDTLGPKVPFNAKHWSGSVWSGKAAEVMIGGKQIKSLSWQFHPFKLLMGSLELGLEFEVKDGYLKGAAGRSIMGTRYINDIEAWIPMSEIAALANLQTFMPAGALNVNLEKLELSQQALSSAVGDIEWNSAEITLLNKMGLGDIQLKFDPADDGIKGVLSDQGGPLQVDGLLTVSSKGAYAFTGALGLRDPQRTDLKNALRSLGRPGNDGKYKITRSGELAELKSYLSR